LQTKLPSLSAYTRQTLSNMGKKNKGDQGSNNNAANVQARKVSIALQLVLAC